ncbi:hypothetical protein QR685DRAFT_528801 [Neurospora intermedia]|uniref:Uncharacterized protein n=1 Tax=Neurospora intermedia TaxID=5142 RepID=A0ABR3D7Y1_NEUIN
MVHRGDPVFPFLVPGPDRSISKQKQASPERRNNVHTISLCGKPCNASVETQQLTKPTC